MKKYLFLCIIPFIMIACGKKNPIVFTKQSDDCLVTLSLDTNGTFEYTATSKVGSAFNEKGTYTIEDSVLILRFQYESYEHLCYEIPLPNDTTLILNYKGKYVLYPTIKDIPELELHYDNNEQLMEQVLDVYQHKDFSSQIGVRYFEQKSGDISLIYNGDWKVSPFYDSKLSDN